jgi:hypothetical protein
MSYYEGSQTIKRLLKGVEVLVGIIVCGKCDRTIEHVEDTKVRTLYATCQACKKKDKK